MHNAWTVVAFALVVSTIIKGLCDYLGTYLVNYAGFGMITDLRNHLYEATLRRSSSFFHKHPTGTILSTLINDVDRVQIARQFGASANSCSSSSPSLSALVFVISTGRPAELGAAAVCSGGDHLGAQDRPAKCAPAPAPGRTSWPRFRTFCMRPSPATAS